MQSKFNAIFNTYVNEAAQLPAKTYATPAKTSNQLAISKALNRKNINKPQTNATTANTVETSALSSNTTTPEASSQTNSDSTIANSTHKIPEILRNFEAQANLISGEMSVSWSDIADLIDKSNEKNRLNALYGIIDYSKSKTPIITMQPNSLTKSIEQYLNDSQQ